jgi:hypothetical protein
MYIIMSRDSFALAILASETEIPRVRDFPPFPRKKAERMGHGKTILR